MTVSAQTPINSYLYAGSATFVYSFQILRAADLAVTVDGVAKTLGVDYTVSGVGVQTGGSIAYISALTTGQRVTLARSTTLARANDYQDEGDFLAATVNSDLDQLWRALQDKDVANQAFVRGQPGETFAPLLTATARAGKLLGFDAVTGAITYVTAVANSALALAAQLAGSTGSAIIGFIQSLSGSVVLTLQDKARQIHNAKDYGALPESNNAANKTAVQTAITGGNLGGKYFKFDIPADIDYGRKTTDSTTWPSFAGVTTPMTIFDHSKGESYAGFPAAYDGAQVVIWMFTPQTTSPGQHDGNTIWQRGAWAPAYCISNDSLLANPSVGASDNRRATMYFGNDGNLNWGIGQGTKTGAGFTPNQLSWFKIAGFTTGTYAGGSNALVIDPDTGNFGFNTDPIESYHFKTRLAGYRQGLFESAAAVTSASIALRPGAASGSSSQDVVLNNNAGVAQLSVGGSNVLVLGATAGSIGSGTHSVTSTTSYVHAIQNQSATTGNVLKLATTTAAGVGQALIDGYAAVSTKVFSVLGNGNVVNTNNSYGAISDAKLKQSIEPAPSYWGKVKALGKALKKYTLIADPQSKVLLGLIAQEARDISPGLVDEHEDFEEIVSVDDVGNEITVRRPLGTTTLSVKYSVAHLMALGTLTEALERIEALETRLAGLEEGKA